MERFNDLSDIYVGENGLKCTVFGIVFCLCGPMADLVK